MAAVDEVLRREAGAGRAVDVDPDVPRDVVEFPSQVNEVWLREPSLLAAYARHVESGEPLPAGTLERLEAADLWGEGHRTVEYLGATLVDWAWHSLTEETVDAATADPAAFERRVLTEAGIDPDLVPPRYGTGYFKHIFGASLTVANLLAPAFLQFTVPLK